MSLVPPVITFQRYAIGDVYVGEQDVAHSGVAQYPAPIAVVRADISRSHGVTPNTITLEVVPLDYADLAYGSRQGELWVQYEGATLRMRDCLIDSSSVVLDPSGRIYQMTILDRRWKWQYGGLQGHFNRRTETGKLIDHATDEERDWGFLNTMRSPRRIATHILAGMGELSNSDVSALPDEGPGPECKWDFENPARALAELCDMYGCRVVYGFDEKIYIFRLGQAWGDTDDKPKKWESREDRAAERRAERLARLSGQSIDNPPLPSPLPIIRYSESLDIIERPNRIAVVTGPVIRQWDFELEAVGEDIDGVIRPLADLTYAPDPNDSSGGFSGDKGNFSPVHGVNLVDADDKVQSLAKKTCFKWYRVKIPFTFKDRLVSDSYIEHLPGYDRYAEDIRYLGEIKPIIQFQATTSVEDGLIVDNDAIVYGQFYREGENNVPRVVPLPKEVTGNADTGIPASDLIVPGGYAVDTRKAIVKFRVPICRLIVNADPAQGDYYAPANLRLRACFQRRSRHHGSWQCYEYVREQPKPWLGTDPLVLRRDDLTPVIIATFPSKSFDVPTFEDNLADVDSLINEYIDAVEKTFAPRHPTEIVLAGFFPQIDLDGVIRNVSFTIDSGDTTAPITTTVELDQDVPGVGQLSYVAVRQHERILQLRETSKMLRPYSLRRLQRMEEIG